MIGLWPTLKAYFNLIPSLCPISKYSHMLSCCGLQLQLMNMEPTVQSIIVSNEAFVI
jgi:hypothetical protein